MKRLRILNLILLVLIGLGGWRAYEVWRRGVPTTVLPEEEKQARSAGDGLPPVPRKPGVPQMVAGIADKDLFDSSRKAYEGAAPAPQATPGPPPTLKLAGVIVVEGEREALVADLAQGNKQIRMRVGEEISGYKVSRIGPAEVAITGGAGAEIVLGLEIEKGKGGGRKPAFGPGGKPSPVQPQPQPPPQPGQQITENVQPEAVRPSFGPPGAAGAAGATTDARKRAEQARERLKKLRDEAQNR